MKFLATFLCLVVAVCADTVTPGSSDVLAPFISEQLNEVLKEASGGWPENLSFAIPSADIVEGSKGWLSFREVQLYNLSTWTLAGNAIVNCESSPVSVKANISFKPLSISLSYMYDNGTVLGPSRSLWATLSKLAAQLVLQVDLSTNDLQVVKFELQANAMMPELSDDSMEDDFKNNMTAALRQMLISESHTSLNKLIKDVIVKNLPPASNLTVISHTCLTTVSSSTVLTTPIQPSKATTSTTNSTSESGSTETDNTKPTSEAITSTTNSNTVSSSTTVASNESYHSYRLENREKSPNLIIFDTDTDHSAQVNEIISSLLSKTGEMFSGQKLQPYNLADFEQELYQSKIGAAILEVGLSGLRSLAISGNPDIQMMHTMVMATTDITFTNLKYSAKVVVDSTMSTWMAQGNAENLMGQLMVDVNWTNTSSNAIVVFKGFKLLPFVSLTGNFTTVAPTERDYPDENELMGVVRGAFISKIISKLQDAASEPVKNATSGKVWNIEAALATTQAPTQTPVHGSASPLSPLRAWAFALASSLPAMLAAKMLL